ncbi:MAG: PLP-dependent cysteine synthase family protein [Nitrososphaerales archaeon]
MLFAENVLSLIGETPLVKLNKVTSGLKPLVLAKLEFLNPGGSVKDRVGIAMLREAIQNGQVGKGGTIVEPTSGNTGVGLALACIILGLNLIVTMPDKMSVEKQNLLRAYGAKVIVCPTNVPPGDSRNYISVAKKIASETPNAFMPNQYVNKANPKVHYETTGKEVWQQTEGKLTCFVAGIGTGGTISGVGKFLKEKNKNIKIIGVDPEGSVFADLFKGVNSPASKTYKIEGIGEDFLPETTDLSVLDEVIKISDKDAYLMARRLAREEAILGGSSSGAAVAGALKIASTLEEQDTIVTLLPDRGDRYLTKLYNDEWIKENGFF